jgi:hypothetical protein
MNKERLTADEILVKTPYVIKHNVRCYEYEDARRALITFARQEVEAAIAERGENEYKRKEAQRAKSIMLAEKYMRETPREVIEAVLSSGFAAT